MSEDWSYEKIRGMGPSFFGTGGVETLYLAPDYLLVLQRSGATESARRYSYKDVQALTCFKTNAGLYTNVAFTAIVLVFAGLAYSAPMAGLPFGWVVAFLIFGSIFLVCLIINAFRGATCVTTLHSAVHAQKLYSLRRIPKAERGLDRISERIHTAQEALDGAQVAAQVTAQAQGAPPKLPVTHYADPALRIRPRTQAWYGGAMPHYYFFGLLLLLACSMALNYFVDNGLKSIADWLMMLSIAISGLFAAIRQRNSNLSQAVRLATNVSFGMHVVLFYGAVIIWSGMQSASDMLASPEIADAGFEGFPPRSLQRVRLDPCRIALRATGRKRVRHPLETGHQAKASRYAA